jgi:hypothetical protein
LVKSDMLAGARRSDVELVALVSVSSTGTYAKTRVSSDATNDHKPRMA